MADTNPFPRTVASITREGKGPQTHAYDDPDIGPIEFLLAVMRAQHLPMATRIDAAKAILPFTEPRPTSIPSWNGYTIIIPPLCSPWPRTQDRGPSPEQINEKSQSKDFVRGDNRQPLSGAPGPSNMMRDPEPSYLPDYSLPPDPAVFAAALKYGLPEPHLCSYCGHWLTTTYPDCICASRDPSKMN